jgi:hypothetical protein
MHSVNAYLDSMVVQLVVAAAQSVSSAQTAPVTRHVQTQSVLIHVQECVAMAHFVKLSITAPSVVVQHLQ